MYIEIHQARLQLLREKCLFWEQRNILLIADLHLGKINHFRRSGIPVPTQPNDQNLDRLINLLHVMSPGRVIFMGDLFHSHYNAEWEVFGQTLSSFPEISFELVLGNHDILSDYQYEKHKLIIHKKPINIDRITLSHEPLDKIPEGQYNLAGHIHPGVRLNGKGKQSMFLPCYYFGLHNGILPAFGQFTGFCRITPKPADQIFVIVDDKIIKVG